MKNFIVITLVAIAATTMVSCSGSKKIEPARRVIYWEETIDGCTYLVTPGYAGRSSLAHKGNCQSPEHGNVNRSLSSL
jgi:hypothetical protein